jgi:putative hemolysin
MTVTPRAKRTGPLTGTLLKIRDGAKIGQRSLLVLARDRTIALAHDLSGAADPTLHGARVRVWSDAVFDASYDLPVRGWRVIGTSTNPRGYRYDDRRGIAGPVRSVVVKDGVLLKITARGMPDVSLATAPDPVGVTLTSGDRVYCLAFGGTVKFSSGRSYVAKNAPLAPCP